MPDNTRQINRRFDAGITAADDSNALALEQRAVTVRTIGDAMAAVFFLSRHVHFAPTRTRRDNYAAALEHTAACQVDFHQAVVAYGQGLGLLQVHDIDTVITYVLFQASGQFLAIGFFDGNKILDSLRFEHLSAETFGHNARP